MHNEIQADRNNLHKAQWEGKTDNLLFKEEVRERIAKHKAEREAKLNARRERLAELYHQDELEQ
jgi:hypothetical protein